MTFSLFREQKTLYLNFPTGDWRRKLLTRSSQMIWEGGGKDVWKTGNKKGGKYFHIPPLSLEVKFFIWTSYFEESFYKIRDGIKLLSHRVSCLGCFWDVNTDYVEKDWKGNDSSKSLQGTESQSPFSKRYTEE